MSDSRNIASLLLLLTGVGHAVQGVLGEGAAMAGFGILYLVVGLLLRRPGNLGLWLGAIAPLPGVLAGVPLVAGSGDPLLAAYVAIDIAVVAICVRLLVRGRAERPAEA